MKGMIRIKLNKNNLLLLFAVLTSLCFVEIISYIYISIEKEENLYSDDVVSFYKKYSKTSNHLRSLEFLYPENEKNKKTVFGREAKITDLIVSLPYPSNKNKVDLLIQGDSWAQQFLAYSTKDELSIFEKLKPYYNIYVAGVSSYSPSLMESQLNYLIQDFDITPGIIVAIVDQTDIGDELCRYRNLRTKDSSSGNVTVRAFDSSTRSSTYDYGPLFKKLDIINANAPSLYKLIRLAVLGATHNQSGCSWSDISSFLTTLDKNDEIYFKEVLESYIVRVLLIKNIKKLILVTHFHEGHRSGKYKINVSEIVNQVLNDKFPIDRRVTHLEFSPNDLYPNYVDGIFYQDDPASHLRPSAHSGHYATRIVSKILN